ncbi:MAG: 2-hydroxyglutaryl-CoA dehydratase [Clostridiales bacterium]|nr:2-hydroxyglutaryl-CoA dehydratase [Clostridiales bacterium]
MKITFPHFGDAYIAISLVCKEMDVECVVPPLNNIATLERGTKYSPEDICLPFKVMVGNLMNSIDNGADTVAMVSSDGQCRLGEYGELLKSILDKNGYHARWILLDAVGDIGIKELLKRGESIWEGRKKSGLELLKALKDIYKVIKSIEHLEEKVHELCGYAVNPSDFKRILYDCKSKVFNSKSIAEANTVLENYHKKINKIPLNREKNPVKVVLTGEIYSLIEPFANQYLEDKLIDMGVCFSKKITIGWWLDTTITGHFKRMREIKRKNGYLNYAIGGYAKDTVEEVIEAKTKDYDGVIQLLPLGCMPEIVAKSIISEMSKEIGMKVLTIVFDEMNGEAGYMTRIEAFIDMLQRRKQYVLYGH